ncbi:MAG: ABC transporter ATP-binding protein [Myxococcales bacterium]|jgi:ABC-2 type transport system ATP-binding protein
MPPVLHARDLVKEYPLPRSLRELVSHPFRAKRRRALDGLTLSLEAGERVALVGPNGAGKTTLARILCGVVLPDTGTALIGTRDVAAGGSARREVGLARPDDPALHPRLDVVECLRFHRALYGAAEDRLTETLERVGAADLATRRVQGLSAGERAKVSLAKALMHAPSLLILDELSRVLDPGAAARTRHLLSELSSSGKAVLLITHDLNEAAHCDRVVVMDGGRIRAQGKWCEVEGLAREVFGL